jgi:nucleosome binding factor SPN SPT16 subunit
MTKNFGFGIGIEFRESGYLLGPKNDRVLVDGMILNIAIGFQNLTLDGVEGKNNIYSLFIADTVHIRDDEVIVLTEAEKELSTISYSFGDDDEEEEKEIIGKRRGAILESQLRNNEDRAERDARRKEHQKRLSEQRHKEGLERFVDGTEKKEKVKAVFKKFESYRPGTLPRLSELKITVDRRAETVLLPIYGQAVPFHLSTLKNISKSDEGEHILVRFNFITPGQATGKKEEHVFEDPNATFVRTLSYRSNEIGRMTEIVKEITDMKRDMNKREQERAEKAGLVEQDELQVVQGRRPLRLGDVFVRPGLEGKRYSGDLEIHVNGLRYLSSVRSDQKVDILFSNIKHLFFQPCDGEMIILLHIHLVDPIMIGKKKTKDVQFYRDVSDASFDETGNRRRRANYGDEDELAQEQEERRHRQMLNKEFMAFSERISDASKKLVDVDVPFRDLGFPGVPHRQLVTLQPTTDCLIHLSDTPFLVVTLSDVEVAHLERVQFGLKNFDLVLVFKDFSRPVVHVNTIPVQYLEHVKDWLDSVDIPFSEGPVNLSWPQIMKTIQEDPKGFFEETGGWSFLQQDASVFRIDVGR